MTTRIERALIAAVAELEFCEEAYLVEAEARGCDAGHWDGGTMATCEHCRLLTDAGRVRAVIDAGRGALLKDHERPFRSLAGMVYTECPCGCGSKEICETQRARVKAQNDALPY